MLKAAMWKPNENLPAGKGATLQQFTAIVGKNRLEIDVAPWGEGFLKVNGVEIAHVKDRKSRNQAFADLKVLANRHLQASRQLSEKQ